MFTRCVRVTDRISSCDPNSCKEADSHMHYRMSDLCEHNYSEHTKCEHNHSENKDDERPVQLWV